MSSTFSITGITAAHSNVGSPLKAGDTIDLVLATSQAVSSVALVGDLPPTLSLSNGMTAIYSRYDAAGLHFSYTVASGDDTPDLQVSSLDLNGATISATGNISFSAFTTFPAGTSPLTAVLADLNGDSKLDVVAANYTTPGTVSILFGHGDGTFGAATTYETGGQYPSRVTLVDINNDGKLDILAANQDGGSISIFLGNGSGGFGPATLYPVGNGPESISVVDINGDGKLDLIVPNVYGGNVSVLLGNGSGGFGAPTNYPSGASPYNAVVRDVNGDGKPDIITANYGNNNIAVLLNAGSGGFGAPTTYSVGGPPFSLVTADLNGDGRLDVVTANNTSGTVSVLFGNGSGGFSAATNYIVGAGAFALTLGDVNGDGNVDIVTAIRETNQIAVLLGDGHGSFGGLSTYAAGSFPSSVALADLNGDNTLDVVVADLRGNAVGVLLNRSSTAGILDAASLTSATGRDTHLAIDTVAPIVASVAVPANGTYKAGDTLVFTVNIDEAVTVTGTPQLNLTIGSTTVHANYVSATGSNALTFKTTVPPGQQDADGIELASTLTLNGGTIQDAAGNNANLMLNSVPSTAGVRVDAVAPTLAITSDLSTLKIGQTATITFTFSEDPGTTFAWDGTSGAVTVSGGSLSAISGTGLTRTATFTPTAGTDSGTASITVAAGSYTDAAGNNGGPGAAPSLTYDTKAPNAPFAPALTSGSDTGSSSTDGITSNTTPEIQGTAEASSTITLRNGSAVLSSTIAVDGTGHWSYTPTASLSEGVYTLTATAADAAGNVSSASEALTITLDTTAPVLAFTTQGGSTYAATQTVAGTVTDSNVPVGAIITLKEGATTLGTAVVQTDGTWSTSINLGAYGAHTITASGADLAGNTGQAQLSFILAVPDTPPDPSAAGTVSPAAGQTQTLSGLTSGSLTVDGAGTLILTGTNTYTGPTEVKAGTLIVDGSIVSPVTVGSGATLGGHGSTGTVTIQSGGTLSPGNSPGLLSTKDLSLASGSVLKEEIGGTATGQFDQLKVTGMVAVGGATLDLHAFGSFVSVRGDSFVFIDNDGTDAVFGSFAGLSEGASLSLGARSYQISYHGGDGNDVVLTDVTRPSEAVLNLFGSVEHSAASQAGSVYALYEALLDRAPDPLGLEGFTTALKTGMSLADIAQALLTSPEHGPQAASTTTYVESLYANLLNRPADGGGLAFFTDELTHGVSQAQVAVQVATSAEAQAVLKPVFDAGVFVGDASETAVARLYYGLLERAPDAGGLQSFETVVKQGAATSGVPGAIQALKDVAGAMLASPEYAATHGSLTNAQFVVELYEGALGRHADTAGLSFWQDALAHGTSRADVALGISESIEAQIHLVNQIEAGWHLVA
ncbi:FG-GAP-like repeat-containing protein [Methylobacterium planeticum]|uniref:DUF4214 domain-containing protein n=1 Tax=Methylobacterium planeticum TaxID=2615211 RepID=A0A6N6MKL8_9HYPH|nr:FG-GAP-like repeat-containing protein [Methylobacterium planeticum]KAB1071169.1 DUF4214 domain-containing protein [Methylobacterium planeticum]